MVPSTEHVDSPEARRYNRISRRIGIADAAIGLVFLVLLLFTDWTGDYRDFAWRMVRHSNYMLALAVYVFCILGSLKMLGFGLDWFGFRVEHRYHLSNQSFGAWLWDQAKGFLLSIVLSVFFAELFYFMVRNLRQSWWIVAWISFNLISVFFAQIAPVVFFPIFYSFETLRNEGLRERLMKLCERAHTRVRGVYEWHLSEKSRKANAALMGLGNTRRIVVSDTLLASYTDDEIEAVLAHELGHHVHRHIALSIAVQAIISFVGFWAIKIVIRWAEMDPHRWLTNYKQYDFANLPLVVLVTTLISLVLLPFMNAFSRFNERQADRYAWKSIPSVGPFITAMDKLATQNLAEREPSRMVEMLFHSHPPISRRIKAAEQWAEKNLTAPTG